MRFAFCLLLQHLLKKCQYAGISLLTEDGNCIIADGCVRVLPRDRGADAVQIPLLGQGGMAARMNKYKREATFEARRRVVASTTDYR
jgi:hypothetical protein